MAHNSDEIIDLCDSFILADHQALTNVLIELDTDDSVIITDTDNSLGVHSVSLSPATTARNQKRDKGFSLSTYFKDKQKNKRASQKIKDETICNEDNRFGDCPICFDPLGKNPLASTKCGHVYCMKCIQQYLLFDKRCPTCRQQLKRKSAYHPLYLNN